MLTYTGHTSPGRESDKADRSEGRRPGDPPEGQPRVEKKDGDQHLEEEKHSETVLEVTAAPVAITVQGRPRQSEAPIDVPGPGD